MTTSVRSAEDVTPTVMTSARSAGDATPAVTYPAGLTVNPAIIGVVMVDLPTKAPRDFGPTTITSFTEISSSDVICRTKGGVFLMLSLAPAKPVGTGMSTGFGIT